MRIRFLHILQTNFPRQSFPMEQMLKISLECSTSSARGKNRCRDQVPTNFVSILAKTRNNKKKSIF